MRPDLEAHSGFPIRTSDWRFPIDPKPETRNLNNQISQNSTEAEYRILNYSPSPFNFYGYGSYDAARARVRLTPTINVLGSRASVRAQNSSCYSAHLKVGGTGGTPDACSRFGALLQLPLHGHRR
jgi:hypothetical protein